MRLSRWSCLCVFILTACLVMLVSPKTGAQITQLLGGSSPGEGPVEDETSPDALSQEEQLVRLETRISETESLVAENQIMEESGEEQVRGIPMEIIQGRTAAYRKLLMGYQRQYNALRDLIELESQRATEEAEREDALQIQEEPPYTIAFLDGLLNTATTKQMDVEAEALSLRALRELVSMEYSDIAAARTALNRASERLRGASQADRPVVLYEVDTARILLQANEAEHEAARLELARTEAQKTLLEMRLDIARERLERARAQTVFRQEELDAIIERQEATAQALSEEAQQVRNTIEQHRSRIAAAESALERAADEDSQQRARDDLELARRRMEAARIHLAILESLQEYETDVISLWRMRFWVANPTLSPERPDWAVWANRLREQLDLFNQERNAGDRRAVSLRSQITALEARLAQEEGDRRLLEQQLAVLREREAVRTRFQMRMYQITNLAERVLDEVRMRQQERSWAERFMDAGRYVYGVGTLTFDRELVEVGGESITIRKLFYMIVILVVGFALGRLAIRWLRNHALERMHLRSNVVLIFEKLSNYLLFIIVVYIALSYVNIPLTIFAFLGGAIAIGIGFGGQNLISNFLSGLILMGEQPIRLGDWVEVEGNLGIVTNIGARASRLRMFTGVDTLIPNSKFLENNVINWTLSDRQIRLQVKVGVAYGSPTRDAARLILRAVTEHGLVEEEPEPKVIFEDFGDNALMFSAYFWVELGPNLDARIVMSDIRHRIDKLFKEAGIVIAFPQRDVHLDTTAPLAVQVYSPGDEPEAGDEEEAKPRPKLPG